MKKIRWDRFLFVLSLIGLEYFFWLTAKPIQFSHLYIIGFISVCSFITLYKNPILEDYNLTKEGEQYDKK